jgi:hypothetical protein
MTSQNILLSSWYTLYVCMYVCVCVCVCVCMYVCVHICVFVCVCMYVSMYVCIVHAVSFLKHSWHSNTSHILWKWGEDKILSKLECVAWFLVSKWRQEDMPQCAVYTQFPIRHQKHAEQSSSCYFLYNLTLENSRSSCHLNFLSPENTATCTQPAAKSVVLCEESIVNYHDILTWTVKGINWRKYKTDINTIHYSSLCGYVSYNDATHHIFRA